MAANSPYPPTWFVQMRHSPPSALCFQQANRRSVANLDSNATDAKLTNEQFKPNSENPFAAMSIEQLLKIAKDAGI